MIGLVAVSGLEGVSSILLVVMHKRISLVTRPKDGSKGTGVGLTVLEKGQKDKAKQDSEYDIELQDLSS